MDNLVINVSWEYFLGLLGSLIAIAYYTNGRFTALETDVGWLRDTISQLLINAENVRTKLFKNGSPVALTATGYRRQKANPAVQPERRIENRPVRATT
jgi:hypothetical protein